MPAVPGPLELELIQARRAPIACVNGRFLERPVTGVERYAREVTRRLGPLVRVVRAPPWARGGSGHIWEQLVLPRRVHRDPVLWSPANSGPLGVECQVVTLHDVGPIDHPEWFGGAFAGLFQHLVPRLVRRVQRVITSSRFSRDRILDIGGLEPDRVVVISPGVDSSRFRPPSPGVLQAIRLRYGLPERYLLAVGSRSTRKNLTVLASAMEILRPRYPSLGLVIVGDPTHTAPTDDLGSSGQGARLLGRVPDSVLPGLYGAAAAFVFPSLYEGFGLPVLEAMACGTPVLASNRAGVPEAAGDAGILFDPEDTDGLARLIEELEEDPLRRRSAVARGFRHARELTWERTARAVLHTLTEASS